METNEIVSLVFTVLSMLFYGVVFIPQFIEIYKLKKSDGISIWTILLWCQADTLSLLGTIILQLHIGLVVIGWYHMLMGQILLIYILRMQTNKQLVKTIFVYVFVFTNLFISLFFQVYVNNMTSFVAGQIVGWISSLMYIIGRTPQLYHNYKRKSTEGLSILLYVFSICGNLCYMLSILTYSSELCNIILNLPWIVLTIGTGILDIFIILQWKIYKKEKNIITFKLKNISNKSKNNQKDDKFYEIV